MKWGAPSNLNWLFLLLPLALVLWALYRRKQNKLKRLSDSRIWSSGSTSKPFRSMRLRISLRLAALALLIIAIGRPQWGFHWKEVKQRGLNVMIALDTSKSMLADDIKPNRIERSKLAIKDLLKQLQGDRVGLTAFSGSAFLHCPLTSDYAAFLMQLNDLYAGIIPRGGTDIEGALEYALKSFSQENSADNVVILISDGENQTGEPLSLIPELQEADVRVFSIGVGTPEGALIPLRNSQNKISFLKDKDGNAVKTRLNENTLKEIALESGGFYVRAAPGDFGLKEVYRRGIAHLQKDEQKSRRARIYQDRFFWFIGLAILILVFESAFEPRRRVEQ